MNKVIDEALDRALKQFKFYCHVKTIYRYKPVFGGILVYFTTHPLGPISIKGGIYCRKIDYSGNMIRYASLAEFQK